MTNSNHFHFAPGSEDQASFTLVLVISEDLNEWHLTRHVAPVFPVLGLGFFFCHLSDKKLKFLGNRQLNMKTYYWKEVSENHMMINDLLDKGTLSGHNETINKQN